MTAGPASGDTSNDSPSTIACLQPWRRRSSALTAMNNRATSATDARNQSAPATLSTQLVAAPTFTAGRSTDEMGAESTAGTAATSPTRGSQPNDCASVIAGRPTENTIAALQTKRA